MNGPRIIILLTVIILLAACGQNQELTPTPSSPGPGAAAPAETPSPTAEPARQTVTLYVGPALLECQDSTSACLQVKRHPDEGWTLLPAPINGFKFQPGFEYELRVSEAAEADSANGSSNQAMTLIEVVSEVPTTELEGTMWILSSYGDQDDPQPVIEQHRTLFAIFDAGGVHGNTGCNSFNYTSVTRGWREISVDPSLMVTMVLCQGATRRQEQALLSTLSGAESYHIWNGTLRIFSTDDRVLTFVGEKAHGSPEPRSPSIA